MDFADLITATYSAFLVIIGWLITSQIKTNKTLSKTITDVVMEMRQDRLISAQREESQQKICALHRADIDTLKKHVDLEIRKSRHELNTIITYKHQ